ncbi:AAA family ATPase [Mycoplasmopsis pulmonis]|uniref:AAA family ATPase n=1 Tax=Mycoplasmopsis pulmonis TaxID=2107 RepID=UPI002ACD4634|nr:AAA family ATPase [Mycoplasmopsis pulmonis]MDZ7293433.1 AAA family ATPase [Mycoplasmopsis pulmonis]
MKLIKIQAHGFKSFAEPIQLSFDGGVAGIIGPNGSGKSNINDAIKWVLGEQSSKSLRGDNMEDVIFAGSKNVKEMNKASVTLTFDNSNNASSVPHKVFTITRELERGKGSNIYYINDEIVRYKDIKDIALESGISKSSLAIISQGTVSDIAEASPEDRRGIFEEAAGVSKYKSRKKEALRKLEKTNESLEKIQTVILELEKQLKPLKNQAEKARIYLQKSKELKDVEVGLIIHNLDFYSTKLKEFEIELEGVVETKENLEQQVRKCENIIEQNSGDRLKFEKELHFLVQDLDNLNEKLRNLELISANENQRRELIISGQIKVNPEEKMKVIKEQLQIIKSRINFYTKQTEELNQIVSDKKNEVQELEKTISTKRIEQNKISNKLNETKVKINILLEHKKNKTNMFKGTKTIVEHKNIFKGYHGLVSEVLKVDQEYIPAIDAVLNNALQHIVVEDAQIAVTAVNFLKKNDGGRATFIPLKSIKPKSIKDEHFLALNMKKGFIDVASNLVKYEPKFEVLSKFLLGNILVVSDIESAKDIAAILDNKYMIVTLEGDLIRTGGVITGGVQQASTNLIGLDEQIAKLEEIVPIISKEVENTSNQITNLEHKKYELTNVVSEFSVEAAKVYEKLSNDQKSFDSLTAEYQTISAKDLGESSSSALDQQINEIQAKKVILQAQIRAKKESILSLNTDFSKVTLEKNDLEKSLRILNDSFSKKITEKNKAEFYLDTNQKRLSEFYNMTYEMAKDNFSLSIDITEAEEFVGRIKEEIKDLGNINIDSIKSYEEISERYDGLKATESEIVDAKDKIESAIKEMDKIIITKLRDTLSAINEEFNNVFQSMFGGGEARVEFVDPSDILESGIDIKAQPPGKSIKNLKLFSGGEKSLIAISLLFAILKSKPLPLCILDEVEAALDDANVVRYAEYLQKLKTKTQFLVITHRHGTMSRVDHLFGATMQTRGVTSFFSVELARAKELIKDTKIES